MKMASEGSADVPVQPEWLTRGEDKQGTGE